MIASNKSVFLLSFFFFLRRRFLFGLANRRIEACFYESEEISPAHIFYIVKKVTVVLVWVLPS